MARRRRPALRGPLRRRGTPAGTTTVDGDVVPTVAHLGTSSFTHPGPLGVGETTLTLPTDGAPVEVWYPATKASVAGKPIATYNVATWLPPALQKLIPAGFAVTYPSGGVTGVPVAPGRYPLIVFSHGYAGFRDQSTFLTAFLASWGFVVAAPDHYSRDLTEVLGGPTAATEKTTDVGDLKATIALMGTEDHAALERLPRPHRHREGRRRRPLRRRSGRRGAGRHRSQGGDLRRTGRGDRRCLRPDEEGTRTASFPTSPACSCPARPIRW